MADKPTAVITGAAGGIGRALAAGFRAAGYDVIGVDRDRGATASSALDVTRQRRGRRLRASSTASTCSVNAAGVIRRHEEYDPGRLRGGPRHQPHRRHAPLPPPASRRSPGPGGAIINIASMYAFFGAPHAPAYAASKGGVVQLTKSLAIAWAKDGIRVNAIAPGWIVTPMTANARARRGAQPRHPRPHADGPLGRRRTISSARRCFWRATPPASSPAWCCRSTAATRSM